MSIDQKNPINILADTLREVFRRFRYVALAVTSGAAIGTGIVWLSNHQIIRFALASDAFDWSAKIRLILISLGSYITNFTLASQIMIALVALAAGINIAMLVFYFKKRAAIGGAAGAGGFGLVIGTLGAGCSACGSVILSSLLGITSASALISVLPLGGIEFGLLSITLIGFSIYNLAKKIRSPETCAIKSRTQNIHP